MTALLLFLPWKEIIDATGQSMMKHLWIRNYIINAIMSYSWELSKTQELSVAMEHPNQIKQKVTERLQTYSLPLFFSWALLGWKSGWVWP